MTYKKALYEEFFDDFELTLDLRVTAFVDDEGIHDFTIMARTANGAHVVLNDVLGDRTEDVLLDMFRERLWEMKDEL